MRLRPRFYKPTNLLTYDEEVLLTLHYGCSYVAKIHFIYLLLKKYFMFSKKSFIFKKVFYVLKKVFRIQKMSFMLSMKNSFLF